MTMREIKFRAWDKEKKIWVSNGEIEFSLSEGTMVVCPNTVEHIGDSVHDMYVAERFEVQQSTGLKDRHGVEIYEGDIVQYSNHKAHILGLRWSDEDDTYGLCMQTVQNPHYRRISQITRQDRISERYEVVGNIYENPELLRESEDI